MSKVWVYVEKGVPKLARPGRSFLKIMLEQVSTANGVLLVVQAVLAQPPYDDALPPFVYVWVNAGVILLAGIVRISAILGSNKLISRWIEADEKVPATVGGTK